MIIDKRAATSVGRDFTAKELLGAVRRFYDRRDDRFVGAGAHQVGGRPAATEQGECANDDRLAGTRLAREDIETWPELKFEGVDDGQVANAKEADHGPAGTRSSIVSYI